MKEFEALIYFSLIIHLRPLPRLPLSFRKNSSVIRVIIPYLNSRFAEATSSNNFLRNSPLSRLSPFNPSESPLFLRVPSCVRSGRGNWLRYDAEVSVSNMERRVGPICIRSPLPSLYFNLFAAVNVSLNDSDRSNYRRQ